MAGGKKKKGKNPSLQKEIFLQVFNQLSNNMEWLKSHVGEKKMGQPNKEGVKAFKRTGKRKERQKGKINKRQKGKINKRQSGEKK